MDFTINFQANTTGDHYIGYRTYTDAPNTYTVVTVNVVTPGAQSVIVPVPESLYCAHADVEYSGYVIAACMDQTDGNSDGVPDLSLTWTLTLAEQIDPCIETDIVCESVPLLTVTVDNDGTSACTDGTYALVFTEVTAGDEVVAANVDVTVAGGLITGVSMNGLGQYKAVPNVSVVIPNCSTSPAFTAVLGNCPALDLGAYKCEGQNDLSETPDHTLALGAQVTICADAASLAGLLTNFADTAVANCHCLACQKSIITVPGGSSGSGKITYQSCWDGSNPLGSITMISQVVNFGDTIDLGCIIPETLNIDNGNLIGGVITSTLSACV